VPLGWWLRRSRCQNKLRETQRQAPSNAPPTPPQWAPFWRRISKPNSDRTPAVFHSSYFSQPPPSNITTLLYPGEGRTNRGVTSVATKRNEAPSCETTPPPLFLATSISAATMSFLFNRNRQKTPQDLVRALRETIIRLDTPLEKRRVRRSILAALRHVANVCPSRHRMKLQGCYPSSN
jgi:hypothetical protein